MLAWIERGCLVCWLLNGLAGRLADGRTRIRILMSVVLRHRIVVFGCSQAALPCRLRLAAVQLVFQVLVDVLAALCRLYVRLIRDSRFAVFPCGQLVF